MPESPVGAVDKALLTLSRLGEAGPSGVGLAELAESLGLHKPTLHRTLAALRHRDFVEQVDEGRYRLGPAATRLADSFVGEAHLPVLLRPALEAVRDQLDELVHLGALGGRQIVYLDKVEPERTVRVWSQVGARRPAASTALGRALLCRAGLEPATLAWYAAEAVPAGRLADELAAARRRGWASEVEENEPGIACVAVPVLRGATPVAAVSVTVPVERGDASRREAIGRTLLDHLPALLPAGLSVPGPGPD